MDHTNPSQIVHPDVDDTLVTFPRTHVMLVTLNRPTRLNAIPSWQHPQLEALFRWFDQESSLRCAVITGAGRAFCAGADLKEWGQRVQDNKARTPERWNTAGFGGLSNRVGKKPVIAAVNGLCLGGGMEMAINCDLVIAARGAKFGLPEAKRGVVASAGALPRLIHSVGRQRASEMALLGRLYDAQTMQEWGLVNSTVVDEGEHGAPSSVVAEALRYAAEMAENSPDSIIASREGLRLGLEAMGPVMATETLGNGLVSRMDSGVNMKEGLSSFADRRKPVWTDSKL